MGLFDAFKRQPAPVAVVKRSNGRRTIPPIRRSLTAFAASAQDRFTQSMDSLPRNPDVITSNEVVKLIARSREQCARNDYAKKFIAMVKSNVVGPSGIRMQSACVDPNGKPDTLARKAVESAWKEWGKPDNNDIAGILSFREFCNLAVTTVAINGEMIAVMAVGENAGPWGFSLQLVDPVRLDHNLSNDELGNGNFIRFGIEFNRYGRRVAYYFLTSNEVSSMAGIYGRDTAIAGDDATNIRGRKYQRVPAEFVIHAFIPEQVGQKRGFPWMSTSLLRMAMLGGYEDAAITAARVGAAKMGFFQPGEMADEDDLPDQQEIPTEASPGTYDVLPKGWTFNGYDPAYPSGEFGPFMKSCLRGIACGLNVSYNTFANDLEGVNYSSLRQGALDERDAWKMLQEWFIEQVCQPVFDAWLPRALLSGFITVVGKPLSIARLDKFAAISWTPRRWQWIDPEKEVNAALKSVDGKLKSRSQIIIESGDDPDEVWEESASDDATLKRLDIEPIADLQARASMAQSLAQASASANQQTNQGAKP